MAIVINERQTESVISKRFHKLMDTLSIQSQVFQSSIWNTISPQAIKHSSESHSKNANTGYGFRPGSDGQPHKQRHRIREARTNQNILKSKQGLLHSNGNRDEVTSNHGLQQRHGTNNTKSTAIAQGTHLFHHLFPVVYIQVCTRVGNVIHILDENT